MHWNATQLYSQTGVPRPEAILTIARLRYLGQLLRTAQDHTWALLQMNPTWMTTLQRDVEWFHDHCPERDLLGSFKDSWEVFSALIREKPARWKAWLKTAMQRHSSSILLEFEWFSWHDSIRKVLLDHGYCPKKTVMPKQRTNYCLKCCIVLPSFSASVRFGSTLFQET